MPITQIRLFRDDDGSTPFLEWLAVIESRDRKVYEKCRSYLQRLADFGRDLRRPTADFLRDGVYELRIKHGRVNYRILYGFVGKNVVLVSHGITKEKKVPSKEIDLAAKHIEKFRSNPDRYSSDQSSASGQKVNTSRKDAQKGSSTAMDSAESAVPDEFIEFVLRFTTMRNNVSALVYEVISHAQDEQIDSPQYERLRNLLDGFEDGLIRAGVMQGEMVENLETGEKSFDGDKLFNLWIPWKFAVLVSITPPPDEDEIEKFDKES